MRKRLTAFCVCIFWAAIFAATAQAQADPDHGARPDASTAAFGPAQGEPPPPPTEVKKAWYERIILKGDFRYRYEHIDDESDTDDETRDRHRLRLRIFAGAEVNDMVDVGFQLSSGDDDPVSNNQTLGDSWSTKDLRLDLAYFDFHPLDGKTALNVVGGKMNVPFEVMSDSELMWDSDVRPEGLAANVSEELNDRTALFAHAAYFFAEERSDEADARMVGGQAGVALGSEDGMIVTFGGGYYDWGQLEGEPALYDSTDGFGNETFTFGGEEFYLDDYNIWEIFAEYAWLLYERPLHIFANYAKNTEADDEDTAWLAGAKLGKVKDFGTWDVRYQYKVLEKNSVVAVFTDSDFGGGGTNVKGHEINVGFGLAKNWALAVSYFINDRFIGPGEDETDYTRLQVDLKFKF